MWYIYSCCELSRGDERSQLKFFGKAGMRRTKLPKIDSPGSGSDEDLLSGVTPIDIFYYI